MEARNHGLSPDLVIHPGETIYDVIVDRGLTQKELAQRAGVSEAFLSDVIHGKKDISKGLAMGLSYALDVPSSFWLNLQANYDAELLSVQEINSVSKEEKEVLPVIREVTEYLSGIGAVPANDSQDEMIIDLRKFFRISNLHDLAKLSPAGAFRISDEFPVDSYVTGAWLCICKAIGEGRHLETSFAPTRVSQLIAELKGIMMAQNVDYQRVLPEIMSGYGIDFSIVRSFRGAPVHGYISKKENETYLMVLTIVGEYADVFWFSLFHELGHILYGEFGRDGSFIDAINHQNSEIEKAVDRFAKEALLDSGSYTGFIKGGVYTLDAIKKYALSQGVPAYIVIARLQKDGVIPVNRFATYRPRFKWA